MVVEHEKDLARAGKRAGTEARGHRTDAEVSGTLPKERGTKQAGRRRTRGYHYTDTKTGRGRKQRSEVLYEVNFHKIKI